MARTVQRPIAASIGVAHNIAIGHINCGFELYEKLVERVITARDTGQPFDNVAAIPLVVPALTNMAFAVELLIKVHCFQTTGKYPSGHDIAGLGLGFPQDRLDNLRAIFLSLTTASPFLNGLEYDFGARPPDMPPNSARVAQKPFTYDEAIKQVGTTYIRWRYIYEEFGGTGLMERISFPTFWIVIQTVQQAIEKFRGPVTVSLQ